MECKIPLLLSKVSLAKAGAVIDIGKYHVMIFDQKVNSQITSTGHHWANMRNYEEITYRNVILVVDSSMKRRDKRMHFKKFINNSVMLHKRN